MWLREAISDPPAGARWVIALSWMRSGLLAIAAVLTAGIVEQLLAGGGTATAMWMSVLVGVAIVAAAVCGAAAEAIPGRIQGTEERRWRERLMDAALRGAKPRASHGHPGAAKNSKSSKTAKQKRPAHTAHAPQSSEGVMVDLATTAVEKAAHSRAVFLAPTLAAFTAPLVVLAVWMIAIDWVSGLLLLAFVALVPVMIIFAGKILRGSNAEYRRREAVATANYLEMLEGIGTLKVLGAAPVTLARFAASARDSMQELSRLLIRNQRMIIVNDAVFSWFMGGAAVALLLWRYLGADIGTGDALAGLLCIPLLQEPIDRVGRSFYIGLAGRAQRDRLDTVIESARELPATSAEQVGADLAATARELELRNVSVDFDGERVLHDLSLRIPAGSRLAIVGPSGAGKSTLLRVLGGLQPVSAGEVLVSGQAVNEAVLRERASGVSQHPGMLSGSVRDNLRLAAPNANDRELWQALSRAGLDSEIRALPGGLDAEVGDRGEQLSGGQRRRLAVARALLRNRPVLLLDEPTADLDRNTEARVRMSLGAASVGRTVITIAHRLDTVADAHRVIVLENGRITAQGTPEELASREGYFAAALGASNATAAVNPTGGER